MGLSDLGGPNESQWAYEVEKEKIIRYLEILKSRIAITTDMWTSNKKKGYMAITVHYMYESTYCNIIL